MEFNKEEKELIIESLEFLRHKSMDTLERFAFPKIEKDLLAKTIVRINNLLPKLELEE